MGGAIFLFYGGTAVMRGDIELMGVPPVPPPLGKPRFGLEQGKTHAHSYPRSPQPKSALEYSFNHYFLLIHCINKLLPSGALFAG